MVYRAIEVEASLVVHWLRLYSQCTGAGFDPWSVN